MNSDKAACIMLCCTVFFIGLTIMVSVCCYHVTSYYTDKAAMENGYYQQSVGYKVIWVKEDRENK